MYAVIEFLDGEDRECALVPVLWLVENNTECYWPRTKTEDHFLKLVKSKSAYDKTWPKFPVHKVLHTGEDLHDAEAIMTRFLQLATSDDSGMIHNITKKSAVLPQQNFIEDEEENVTADTVHEDVQSEQVKKRKRKHKSDKNDKNEKGGKKRSKIRHTSHKRGKTKRRHMNSSSSYDTSPADENLPPSEVDESISDENEDNPYINLTKGSSRIETTNRIRSVNSIVTCQSNNSTYNSRNRSPVNVTPTRNAINRFIPRSKTQYDLSKSFLQSDGEPSTPTSCHKPNTFEESTLQCLGHIKTYVDQNHGLLRKILAKLKEAGVEITKKPDEFPKLPLNSMENFSNLEKFLRSEEHRTYLTQKLASIGGTNGRQCVLAIMKSLLTNELAMQFNWAGRDKTPFQKLLTMEIIYEGAKQTFRGKREINDVTESSVSGAVKDWLKLARSRHTYVPKRR